MKRLLMWILFIFAIGNWSHARYKTLSQDDQPQQVDYDQENNQNNDNGNYAMFNSSLSQYGEWVDCNYGHVWRPFHPANQWRPYLNGRWVWTDYGWYWSSYEPFGWATYHYGRWSYDDYYGWIWAPDRVWGPAWVEWRYDDNYIGWAPLTPHALFSLNAGVTLSRGWVTPVHYWNFVPCRNFTTTRVIDYVQPIEQTCRIFGNTRGTINIRTENNRVINRGIDVGFVERRGNTRINRLDIIQNGRGTGDKIVRDGNRDRIEIYRPNLDAKVRGTDLPEQEVRQQHAQPNRENNRITQQDQREMNRKSFDRQQGRTPPEGQNGRDNTPHVRQHRETEQQFELPRRAEQQRREEQIRENHGRQYFGNGRDQQPRPEQRQREEQIRQNHGKNRVERPQQQIKEHSQPRPQERQQNRSEDRGRGRRP